MPKKWETAVKRAEGGKSRDDWRTPEEVTRLLLDLFGGPADLDPCGNAESIVPARRQYLLERGEDGLTLPWRGTVYVNPPFSQLRGFAAKAAEERRSGLAEIVLLMPSRTDTRAWHESISTADAVCFWRGRITFIGAPDPAPFPVAFAYWGSNVDGFARAFGAKGMVVRLP